MEDRTEQSGQQQLKALFEAALDLPPDARAAFLETQTDDAKLCHAVQVLLHAHAQAGDFLVTPPLLNGARMLTETSAGQSLGPYRLLRELGHGGMATVFLATRADDEYQQEVAIKLIWPSADSVEVVRRFRQERQILAQLNHPNIARLFDGGTTDDGWPYLVMEYIAGVPLTRYCNAQRLSIKARLQLFQHVCAAVAYAHRNLVVHRDLKPSNILVTPSQDGKDGVAKLLDFGIAKVLTPEASQDLRSRTGLQWMTPEYASPEQLREEAITTASDIYSLGVLLYELLTGTQPHAVRDRPLHEIIRLVGETEPLPPSARTPQPEAFGEMSADKLQRRLRGDLDKIILKALRKEPEQRYASVEELSADLARHLAGEPVLARQPTLPYRAGKFIRRHPTGIAVTFTLLLALLSALSYAIHQTRQARAQTRAQRRANYAAQMRQASLAWFDENPRAYDEILQSPPVLPQPGEEDLRGLEWRYLWRLGHRERLSFAQTDNADFLPGDKGGYWFTWNNNPPRFMLRDAITGQLFAERSLPAMASTFLHGYLTSAEKVAILYQADGHTLKTMDLLSGATQPLFVDPSPVTCLVVNAVTGLVTGHADGQVRHWETQTGQPLGTLCRAAGRLRKVYRAPLDERLVTLTENDVLQLWDVPRRQELLRLEDVVGLAANRSLANWLVVQFQNDAIAVYGLRSAKKLNTLAVRSNPIVFTGSNELSSLVISHQDNTLRFYALPSLRLLRNFAGHTGWVNSAMLSADNKSLLTASSDRTVKLWDVAKQQALVTLRGHHDDVMNAYWFNQDRQFASVSRDHVLKIWDVAEVLRPAVLTSHKGHVYSVAFSSDSRTLASASQDRTIKLWDTATGALFKTLTGHTGQVLCVNFSPDGQRLVSSGEGQGPRVWDVATGKLLFELCCHQYQQHFATFSPDGKLIATGSDEGAVKLWDATNGCEVLTLIVDADQTGHVQNIWSLAFAPDSRTLAAGTDKGELRLWDIASGRSIAAFHPHGDASIWSIAFTPDGQCFATASGDNTARLWRTASRQLIREFKGHADGLFELAFSPDGQRLATASEDKTVRFWNVATGQELLIFKGHTDQVWSVAFAPDGNTLASGSWDGTVRLWRAAPTPTSQTNAVVLNPAKK